MAVSTVPSLPGRSLRNDSLPVIGPLVERKDAEKLKTLIVVFDRVGGVRKLVQAFKSFLTVRVIVIAASNIFLI